MAASSFVMSPSEATTRTLSGILRLYRKQQFAVGTTRNPVAHADARRYILLSTQAIIHEFRKRTSSPPVRPSRAGHRRVLRPNNGSQRPRTHRRHRPDEPPP